MNFLKNILPDNPAKLKWTAVGVTFLLSGLLTWCNIFGDGRYGVALFIFIPVLTGAAPVILYGLKRQVTKKEAREMAFLSIGLLGIGLFILAVDGIICIAMAAPIGILFAWLGSLIGYLFVGNRPDSSLLSLVILTAGIPALSFVEKNHQAPLTAVVTSVEIKADPLTVWNNVIEFPDLDKPTEFIFKTGIAYPLNARIDGKGVGAVRHCNFTTGSFVEPVTVWEEGRLLKFDVEEQPAPMQEISFWDINAPHLHDYFVSKQGQFKLTRLANGNTLLEGTTWYYHRIRPAIYWRQWSTFIIHKIHERVLNHIKKNAEKKTK